MGEVRLTLREHEPAMGTWRLFENELMEVMYKDERIKMYLRPNVRHQFFNKRDAKYQILSCIFYDEPVGDTQKKFKVKFPAWDGEYTYLVDDDDRLFKAFKKCVLETYNRLHPGAQKQDVRFTNSEFYFLAVPRPKIPKDSKTVTDILNATLGQGLRFMIKI